MVALRGRWASSPRIYAQLQGIPEARLVRPLFLSVGKGRLRKRYKVLIPIRLPVARFELLDAMVGAR